MRIAVYALCKNEAANIQAWYDSCRGADLIVVTDTGSTDGSLTALLGLPVDLREIRVLPWRFDDAFNAAMNALPEDVDVCIRLDFDERLQPGWREALEAAWTPTTTRLRYPYVWNWRADGKPDRQWLGDRIHARAGYRWTGATHEGLVCRGSEVQTITQALHIHQYPEAKLRPNDLVLLEEAVRETPNDARLWGYLGREYYFHGDMEAASRTYRTFLTHNSDTQERVQAMLYLARAEPDSAEMWLALARREGPAYREPLVDLAQLYHNRHDWKGCYEAALAALALAERPDSYICTSEAWGERPQDLAAIAAWNMGLADEAVEHARQAVIYAPDDLRLQANLRYMRQDMAAASRTYRTFLTHNSDTQERVQAMLYLARIEPDSAEIWLALARREGPAYREPLVDLAQLYHNRKDWKRCYETALAALALKERPDSYICTSEAWGERPHDLAAIAAWNMGLLDEAVEHARQAVIYAPDDLRLQANLRYMRQDIPQKAA